MISPIEMDEHWKQGHCYYYDEKYSSNHKRHEQNFFQIDGSASTSSEDNLSGEAPNLEETQPTSLIPDLVTPPMEPKEPVISLHALMGILVAQTLKIKGYIKQT
jgi:hypothetical protein